MPRSKARPRSVEIDLYLVCRFLMQKAEFRKKMRGLFFPRISG